MALGAIAIWCYGYVYFLLSTELPSLFLVLGLWLEQSIWGVPVLFLMLALAAARRTEYYLSPSRPPLQWGSIRWYEGAAILATAYVMVSFLFIVATLASGGFRDSFTPWREGDFLTRFLFSGRWMLVLGPVPRFSDLPLIISAGILPILAGVGVAHWMISEKRSRIAPSALPPVDRDHVTHDRLLSDGFLDSLRTAIPKAHDDEKLGLVGVPWLLASVIERQKRFRRSTAVFLRATIGLAVLLLGILLWLGYALINDDATGLARRTTAVEGLLASIDSKLSDMVVNDNRRQERSQDLNELLRGASRHGLEGNAPQEVKAALQVNANKLINEIPNQRVAEFEERLQEFLLLPILRDWPQKAELEKLAISLREIERRQGFIIDRLDSHLPELTRQADDLRQKLAEPESRIPDLIKRIAVGLLVVSFMAAVLGYSTRLYQQHLSQVIAAEQDEQAVRRYYVAFKGAEDSPELRGAVLAEFMRWSAAGLAGGNGKAQSSQSTPAAALAAEILKAVRQVQGPADGG